MRSFLEGQRTDPMSVQSWQPAAHQPPPAPGEIHVWRIDLAGATSPAAESLLCADERERAGRLLIKRKHAQFIAGRSTLRKVLGQYLGIAPQALVFTYGPHGKPELAREESAAGHTFNFSHSEDLALLAVAHAGAIGIDIEHRRRNISVTSFARHILSESETADLARLPAEQHQQAVLTAWTRKEAYLKALGVGLSRSMRGFTTGLADEGEILVRPLEDADGKAGPWTFIPLAAHPDYLACLAAPGHSWTARRFCWRPVDSIG
jgi:4'-phosphopantetheinyl transferase